MLTSEAIIKYQDKIKEEMIKSYRSVLKCDGSVQYQIYVWEDGEIERLEGVQGDNSYLKANDSEPRELFYVCTISVPHFDPWDYSDHSAPDDDDERESEQKEIIEYMVDEYKQNVSDIIDSIIDGATQAEDYDGY